MNILQDLREVISRGEGSRLKRDLILRKIEKFEKDCRRVGADPNSKGQLEFCKLLEGDTKEWMFRLCAIRLLRGDYSDWTGWEYRSEWSIGSYANLPNKRWRLEKTDSLCVMGEQGIGDEIMWSSCIPDLLRLGIRPVIECDPRLVSVFRRSFNCEARERNDLDRKNPSAIRRLNEKRPEDYFIPIGDLPRLFRKSRRAFTGEPFLQPLGERVDKWRHLAGRTGIAWRGRRGKFSPKDFALENPVCLQYDHWDYETEGMEVPKINLKNDIEDLLGICANLSRIVTVPQTIVHIAGSVGTKVEVIVPPVTSGRVRDQVNYRYGLERQMPWYNSVKVFQDMREWKSA